MSFSAFSTGRSDALALLHFLWKNKSMRFVADLKSEI